MSQLVVSQVSKPGVPEIGWQSSLHRIGGAAAWMAVVVFVLDLLISFGGEDFNPAALTAVDWFALFEGSELAGLRALGLMNVVSLTVSIALYFTLFTVQRQENPAFAPLAAILFLVGAAVYIANNAAVPMSVLSGKYAAAATEAQRSLLAAAGEAVIARGADFTPGSFTGFFFTELAGLAFSWMMLRSRVFSRAAAIFGIVGFALLSVFTVWATFIPVYFDLAMIVAMLGGLSSVAWYVLVGLRLFKL